MVDDEVSVCANQAGVQCQTTCSENKDPTLQAVPGLWTRITVLALRRPAPKPAHSRVASLFITPLEPFRSDENSHRKIRGFNAPLARIAGACRRDRGSAAPPRRNSHVGAERQEPTQDEPTENVVGHGVRFASLTPGPLPFSGMNSTPAASRAARMAERLLVMGVRLPVSKSATVARDTPARSARSV